jgi:hypothetical protein
MDGIILSGVRVIASLYLSFGGENFMQNFFRGPRARALVLGHLSTNFDGLRFSDTPGYIPPTRSPPPGRQPCVEAVNLTLKIFRQIGATRSRR